MFTLPYHFFESWLFTMNRVTVTLPRITYLQLKNLAKRDGVSIDQYVAYAIAQQVEQVETNYVETAIPGEKKAVHSFWNKYSPALVSRSKS